MSVLTEEDLAAATDPVRFDRGWEYVPYVRGLHRGDGQAHASIQAKRVYRVDLDWRTRGQVTGRCTCFDYDEGYFCKHLVAVGLAVLEVTERSGPAEPREGALEDYLTGLSRDELVDLARQLGTTHPGAQNLLLAKAAAAGRADALDSDALAAQLNAALATRGFVDYRRSFEVARDAEEALDRLEDLLNAGAADAVRPALLRAVTRLRKITLQGDDSAGVLGGAGQRAADLYARSCREGHPDPVALARWLVKFRRDSPGWPNTVLPDFVAAFDDQALRTYRKGVARWSAEAQDEDNFSRFEVDRALLELADHDQDLDRAIELLSRPEKHASYAEIIRRLTQAGRASEALEWLDRAREAGRVDGRMGRQSGEYWVPPGEAAELYLQASRPTDAVEVLRADFAHRPGLETWRSLLALGERLGTLEDQRRWAIAQAEELAAQRFGTGAALIEIHLAEGRLEEAWAAARRFGAGHVWEQLAILSAASHPAEAAELYRPKIEELLVHTNTGNYPAAAAMLASMRDLYGAAQQPEVFAGYLADVRQRYARRPSLMAALARRGL